MRDPTVVTPQPTPPPTPTKAGKAPQVDEECDLDVLQRSEKSSQNTCFCFLIKMAIMGLRRKNFALLRLLQMQKMRLSIRLQAAIAIGGGDQAVQALIAVATDACPSVDFDPLSLLEFQSASVLYYCDNDPSAFNFFVNRGASVPVDGLCESRR